MLGGETGTGKSRLAGVIHRLSPRRNRPFLTINCAVLSASLIESEMFGHVKGAFTSADANRVGKFTEVGQRHAVPRRDRLASPLASGQALAGRGGTRFRAGRVEQDAEASGPLIVASNKPLEEEVAAGRFRADLYYRLNVVAFNLPPLRERAGGIPSWLKASWPNSGVVPAVPSFRSHRRRCVLLRPTPGRATSESCAM